MNKKNCIFIAILVLLLTFPISSIFADVTDYATLLSNSQIKTLEEKIATLENLYTIKINGESNKIGIYIITLPNKEIIGAADYAIEELTEALYESYNYGLGNEKTGILLLLDMKEREFDICAHGSAAHYAFTDYGKDELANAFLDDFADNDWYSGFFHYLVELEHQLMHAEKGKPVGMTVGFYTLKSITDGGITFTADDLKEMAGIADQNFSVGSLVINKDGTGELSLMGQTTKLLSNDKIIALEADSAPYTIIDNMLYIYIDDDTMVFLKQE